VTADGVVAATATAAAAAAAAVVAASLVGAAGGGVLLLARRLGAAGGGGGMFLLTVRLVVWDLDEGDVLLQMHIFCSREGRGWSGKSGEVFGKWGCVGVCVVMVRLDEVKRSGLTAGGESDVSCVARTGTKTRTTGETFGEKIW